MMQTDMALADQLVHRRANFARIMAVLLLTTEVTSVRVGAGGRLVDWVQAGAGMIWCLVALAFVAFGGGLVRGAALRAVLNDESTTDHRRRALALGFWVALVSSGVLWAIALAQPLAAPVALRIVVSVSVAVALLRFATLEKRALVDA